MKKLTSPFLTLALLVFSHSLYAQVPVKPAHVIFVLEENYAYSQVIGSALAPTFTTLSQTSYTANFTQDYAIQHPSEANYLELFSGSCQDDCSLGDINGPAPSAPYNDCNLASSLIQHGYTFIGYAEDQPSVGWIAGDLSPYVTKHCPWINWIGYNTNPDTIPQSSDIPYSHINGYTSGPIFPDSNHYSTLPTVAWVIPNSVNDMHDGNASTAIPNGDNWFKINMMPLVRWASNPANKSIVITVWDEDDGGHSNNIPLLISGGMVNGGNYSTHLNHYDLLKTVEDMYGLTECGSSATGVDFPTAMWNVDAGVNSIAENANQISTWPVPAENELNVKITTVGESNATIGIYDVTGRMIKEMPVQLKSGDNTIVLNTCDISNGFYFLKITGTQINLCNKITIAK